ncbi:MAG: FHA domain-containing protein [Bacteriovoracaceae bacterium]|jgi:pSer/pThr/pTyr-binding forkhead associated (FHA) protein|nr:FHA domain-containing protein [Bacteriovoracaceae bacterium]
MSIVVKVLFPNELDMISFELGDLNVRIGRSSKAEITLQDELCSGLHMRIFAVNGKVYVEDLDSKNGTRLNGKKVTQLTQIYLRDEVSIGSYTIALDKVQMTPLELKKNVQPYTLKRTELRLPELTHTGLHIEGVKEHVVEPNTEMFKDLEDLSSKTIVKIYKIKSQMPNDC